MGVKDLWPVLEPARERRSLDTLQGKTVAIDLGVWVCEMQAAVRNPTVLKPHLRNLFFRISALLQKQINIIVVADGKPPELKHRVMLERQKNRYKHVIAPAKDNDVAETKTANRSRFASHVKECMEMLKLLGVTVLESDGEAECSCAIMNANGIVDAVITDDNDSFLYGARLVVRNFNLEGKDPEADFYSMDIIESRLRLSRDKLICLGVFLGSDYCSAGVPGVGKETAMKYLSYFESSEDGLLLNYLKSWTSNRNLEFIPEVLFERFMMSDNVAFQKLDRALKMKAAAAKDLIIDAVIDEYKYERTFKVAIIGWNMPNLVLLEEFFSRHLNWISNYTITKIVPLMTLCQLLSPDGITMIEPQRIIKTRIRNGYTFYEIQWKKLVYDVWTKEKEFYITIEKTQLVEKALPHLVEEYLSLVERKKSRSKKANGRKRNVKTKKTTAELVPAQEDKECVDLFDLSQTLEKSLILIDDDDEPPTSESIIPVEMVIHTENSRNQIHAKEKNNWTLSGQKAINVILEDEKRIEDSPLPLWKRIGSKIRTEAFGK